MQIRRHLAQGGAQGASRRPPADMPQKVPLRAPLTAAPVGRDVLPPQKSLTDDTPLARVPSRWKRIFTRVLAVVGVVLALAIIYIFFLMGEPGEDDQLAKQPVTQEETIRVPIAATQASSAADLNLLAANFGKPVLTFYENGLTLQKATLYDTAFRGGYARRLALQYAFADGSVLLVDSLRPTAAVELLQNPDYTINVSKLYTLAGMDAVRMDTDAQTCLVARGTEAVYAVRCPAQHVGDLSALVKLASLMQGTAQ